MRFIAFCITLIVVVATGTVRSQRQPPLPEQEPSASPNPNSSVPASTPLPAPPAPPLLPDDVLAAPPPAPSAADLQQLDEVFKQKPISATAADHDSRVEWRNLRTEVVNDPSMRAALHNAERAKTDLEKRKLLKAYYELLFDKMIARAATPELKTYLTARKNEHLAVLLQPHVRPAPSQSPAAKASPTATPTPTATPQLQRKSNDLFPVPVPGGR